MTIFVDAINQLIYTIFNTIESLLSNIFYIPIFSNEFYLGYIIIGLSCCGFIFNLLVHWLGGESK